MVISMQKVKVKGQSVQTLDGNKRTDRRTKTDGSDYITFLASNMVGRPNKHAV